jgi:hypothetical protein
MTASVEKPWYRQLWPWLIISGPAAVLVAGAFTMWIAFSMTDGLVADDYYKQGLAINRRLAREDEARRLGISAAVTFGRDKVRVELRGGQPDALFLYLAHATRAGHDRRLRLTPVAPGAYEAALEPLPPGHWHAVIEDPRGAWRLTQDAS